MEIITGTFHDIKISVNGLALQVLFNAIEILPEKAKDFRIFCYLVWQIWDFFCRYLQTFLECLIFPACVSVLSLYISVGLLMLKFLERI